MRDLARPWAIHLKGGLCLLRAVLAATELYLERRGLASAVCIAALSWASARRYYYAFYVIERWSDPSFRY